MAASTPFAPYAVPIGGRLGRAHEDPPDAHRNPFQRDRDRIIHAVAFRRLQGKTQVFEAGESDHVRTRLTHTLEVAQIARDMARRLKLNEDLAECLALAHDLGHPPFGHSGQDVLDEWMREHGGHFEHNAHSLRIVTTLEYHSSLYLGLNLNGETVEGLRKHDALTFPDGKPKRHTMEAQLVNLCDEIAYVSHDCDDGIRSHVFAPADLRSVELANRAFGIAAGRGTHLRGTLIRLMADDLYDETVRRLDASKIRTLDDVQKAESDVVGFSPDMRAAINPLRGFLTERLYGHPSVAGGKAEGKRILRRLCDAYLAHPISKITELKERTDSSLLEAVKDYVAGMTDGFARQADGAEGRTL